MGHLVPVFLAFALLAMVASPASGYPVTTGTLTVAPGTLVPGGSTTISGGGYEPGASVSIDVFSEPVHLADVTASGAGSISVDVSIPTDLTPGVHSLRATGAAPDGGTNILAISFTVPEPDQLPVTGRAIVGWTLAGVLLITGGLGLALLVRRGGLGRCLERR